MFRWNLFFVLIGVTVPCILVTLPRLTDQLLEMAQKQGKVGQAPPPRWVLILLSALQSLLYAAIFSAVGVYLAPRVGLEAPFFSALSEGWLDSSTLLSQLEYGLLFGIGGGAVLVLWYYRFFRPRFDPATLQASEKLRNELGAAGRILYGGIFEEVFARWGVMTLFVWLGAQVTGGTAEWVFWAAVLLSGVVFALLHLPSYMAAGARLTPAFVSFILNINLLASFICGWLYWQQGLLAAIIAHMMLHIVWLPFDRRYYQAVTQSAEQRTSRIKLEAM